MAVKLLGKTGALIKACTMMYKEVFQVVILYWRDIWLVADAVMKLLEVFHHRIAR